MTAKGATPGTDAHLDGERVATARSVFERLQHEEAATREEAASVRRRLEELDERLNELTITRRTLAALFSDGPCLQGPVPEGHVSHAGTESPPAAQQTPEAAHLQAPQPRQASRPEQAQRGGRRGGNSQRIVVLVASADRPLRARDVTVALGMADPTRTQMETVRRTLHKLASRGLLRSLGTGEFTGPAETATERPSTR